jgi:hypothetical protein
MSFSKWVSFKDEKPPAKGLIMYRMIDETIYMTDRFPENLSAMQSMNNYYDWIQIPFPDKIFY